MSKDIKCTVSGERAEFWKSVFGTNTVCIHSPVPTLVNLPGLGESRVYFLDLSCTVQVERKRLFAALAEKFKLSVEEVEKGAHSIGVPIPVEGTIVTFEGAALGLLMDDGEDVADNWGEGLVNDDEEDWLYYGPDPDEDEEAEESGR